MLDLTRYSTINQTQSKEGLSDKYSFIPTSRVIATMEQQGWFPAKITEQRANKEENFGFQKHCIRFRRKTDMELSVGKSILEIVMTNAHNGLSRYNLMLGVWRPVCSNGAVVSEGCFETQSITHKGYTDEKVINAIYKVLDAVPMINGKVEMFQDIKLNEGEQRVFAEASLPLFYDEEDMQKPGLSLPETVTQMLKARRNEDKDNNLWNTYNIIQERMIKGQMYLMNGRGSYISKSRQIKSIDKDIKLNRSLWALTEKMAQIKTA